MVKRRTNQEWQTLFEQYQSSHLSQRVFCERNGLSLSTFYAKRQQLQTTESANISGFVKAEVIEKTYAPHNPTGRFNFSVRRSKAEES